MPPRCSTLTFMIFSVWPSVHDLLAARVRSHSSSVKAMPALGGQQFAHRAAIRRPIHYHLRMLATKGFRDMAAPADREVSLKNVQELFRPNVAPLNRFPIRSHESRTVIVPMQLAESL